MLLHGGGVPSSGRSARTVRKSRPQQEAPPHAPASHLPDQLRQRPGAESGHASITGSICGVRIEAIEDPRCARSGISTSWWMSWPRGGRWGRCSGRGEVVGGRRKRLTSKRLPLLM